MERRAQREIGVRFTAEVPRFGLHVGALVQRQSKRLQSARLSVRIRHASCSRRIVGSVHQTLNLGTGVRIAPRTLSLWGLSSNGRALDLHSRGSGIDTRRFLVLFAPLV